MEKQRLSLIGGRARFEYHGSLLQHVLLQPQLPFLPRHMFVDVQRNGLTSIGAVTIPHIRIGMNAGAFVGAGEVSAAVFRCDELRAHMPAIVEAMKAERLIEVVMPDGDGRLPLTLDLPLCMPGVHIVVEVAITVGPAMTDTVDAFVAFAGEAERERKSWRVQ